MTDKVIEQLQQIIDQNRPDPVIMHEDAAIGWLSHYNYWPVLMDLLRTITQAPVFYDPALGYWFCARCDGPGVVDPANLIHEGDCPYPNGANVVRHEQQAETLRQSIIGWER